MHTRNEFLADFRGSAIGSVTTESSFGETFQNQTLRPILQLQNELLIEVFRNYLSKYKSDYNSYDVQKKMQYIENSIQKDIKFRNSLKGIIIGLFTTEEYKSYITDSSMINKRMMNMVIERLKNQVQLFDNV